MLNRLISIGCTVLLSVSLYGQGAGIRATYFVDGAKTKFDNRSHTAVESMEQGVSVVYATNGVELILTKLRMNKTSGGVNDPDRRNTGVNSVLVADGGSDVLLEACDVSSHTAQADGVSATGSGTKVKLTDGKVTMYRGQSSAVNALNEAKVDVFKTEVNTQSNQSPSFYTYNGGTMDVNEAFGTGSGQASPIFHSAFNGILTANKCRMSSGKWTIANVDGGIMTLTKGELKAGGICGFLLYGAKSNEGHGILTLAKNSISVAEGPLFLVTNTTAWVTVQNNKISCKSGDLMIVKADEWGVKGSNGGHASLFVDKQTLNGDITVDSISSLNLELHKGGKLNGKINATENRCAQVKVKLDAGSTWTSKGDSYLTSIVFAQPVEKGVKQLKGKHTIYYDPSDPDNAPLGGKEYKTGGGRLCPLK